MLRKSEKGGAISGVKNSPIIDATNKSGIRTCRFEMFLLCPGTSVLIGTNVVLHINYTGAIIIALLLCRGNPLISFAKCGV